ncbi:FAD-binding oxidoreductase [Adhaeribacter terreus]|uniref:FAD-binding oxidoreductase n=1 Tax=Adhaeribacter terreus TaxID=529703 RepID=A0ABW0EGY4_9BACT
MSSPYLNLKVVDITQETADAITLHFEHPEKQTIPYKSGQFLTLITNINGKSVRRAYSLCSAPHEGHRLSVTVKRVQGGLMSNFLPDNVKVGDTMEVMAPIGNFCLEPKADATRTVVLLGGGSGITPLMSIAKTVLKNEKNSRVILFYGNRDEDATIFKAAFDKMEAEAGGRFKVEHVFNQPKAANFPASHTGNLDKSKIISLLQAQGVTNFLDTEYYICGPEVMMDGAKEALTELKVPADKVHKESFTATTAQPVDTEGVNAGEATDGTIKTQTVKIIYDGDEYEVTVEPSQTILEAALDQDIDLPYSCQAGLCTACRGKCLSGKVHMDEREGLSDKEMQEGYVLNCVGHPLTSDVVIEIG